LKYLKNEQVSSKKSFRSYISQREEELTNPEIKESHRRFKEMSQLYAKKFISRPLFPPESQEYFQKIYREAPYTDATDIKIIPAPLLN
jgi:hypothetical protein